ncbi:hypothetical protein C0Q70_11462 [Pomacea canaliculata]|uniref:C2H2-type domain-containing protein n=1 Tax=Pomacea canaliculata TaxID=400727 RepID=A0A2T7P623_POMCA|nr:hypothetical protein C0Q70_11462 [Pomacea canaliculata]
MKPEHAWDIPQSNCKHENTVKLEFISQVAIDCIKTEQDPGSELHPIKAECAAHIEHSDCSHESAVKVECHCQDVTCSIKSEQDLVQCAKTEEQLVFKQEEQDDSHIVKTETGWPGQHTMRQNNIDENCQEISVARCITPEVTDIMRENQHQTHATVTKVTIDSTTGSRSDAKPYQCKFSSDFKKHMVTHSDERPHQCSVCHVAFKTPRALKQHMVTHSDLKPYQCTVCHVAFKRLPNLKEHMVSHSDERPHQCSVCHVAFKRAKALKKHMLTHHDVKSYQCSACKKTYRRSSELKRHMLIHSDATSSVPSV